MPKVGNRIVGAILLASGAIILNCGSCAAASSRSYTALVDSASRVIPVTGAGVNVRCLKLTRRWKGQTMFARLHSSCERSVSVASVVVADAPHRFPLTTALYGEGFTMLSLTAGTLGAPEPLEPYTDHGHYRIPQPAGAQTYYGMTLLSPTVSEHVLFGFLSSKRYVGSISIWPTRLEVAFDTEGRTIAPGQTWTFEPVYVAGGADPTQLLRDFGVRLGTQSNARVKAVPAPTGWSSWNALGDTPTAAAVLDNTRRLAKDAPDLDYVQVDDGYQPFMGDWMDVREGFGSSVSDLSASIRALGKRPAIWVAPLIAERDSALFRAHPDWFIRDDAGRPLPSDTVTFGGWRRGPWYGLDGSNPEVQRHLEDLFRQMRQKWGVDYFKLDALFWGAMHGGHLYDRNATRISAYRSALAAIRRGAGTAFITIANAPIWPSIGFADASRSSMDVMHDWKSFRTTARETLYRGWMHRNLWLTDPDSLMIGGQATESELRAHWTSVLMTGGPLLIGDDLAKLSNSQMALIGRLGRPADGQPHIASRNVDIIQLADRKAAINWSDDSQRFHLKGPPLSRWRDVWTRRSFQFGRDGTLSIELEARDALLLRPKVADLPKDERF